jgi:hypothetical protein
MQDPTIVRTFSDRGEAEIARSLLEAEGINASVTADDAGGATPSFNVVSGLQLVVDAGDVNRALQLLDEVVSDETLNEAERQSE